MAARVAIALSLVAFAWTASARAADDPACAQYHDALSYNLCLASHGPRANNLGKPSKQSGPRDPAHDWAGYGGQGRASVGRHRWRGAQPARAHGRAHMEFQVR
jgi:opacity protein-like surface antigen